MTPESSTAERVAAEAHVRQLQLVETPDTAEACEPDQDEMGRFASRAVRRRRVGVALLLSDVSMLLLAAFVSTYTKYDGFHVIWESQGRNLDPLRLGQSLIVVACLAVAMYVHRLYDLDHLGWGSGEFIRVVRALALGVITVVIASFLVGLPVLARDWAILVWLFGAVFVTAARLTLRLASAWFLRHDGWLQRPTLIVGSNVEAAEIARTLRTNALSGLVPVGCLSSSLKDKLSFDYCPPAVPTLGSARDLVRVVTERGIDSVIIVASAFDYEVLQRMIKDLRDVHVGVHISSGLSEVLTSRVMIQAVGGMPFISVSGVSFSRVNLWAKRAFDLIVGTIIIVLGLPIWATIAALVKATTEGPVFYAQERVGKNGTMFRMLKFRTMVNSADAQLKDLMAENQADGPLFKMQNDPRVTPVGKWLRRFSFDEFPQLINVMKGEMSLVGPRPPLKKETDQYAENDWRRLDVSPGMTGLWQVSGRSNLAFREMVRLDMYYIDNWSVTLDLALLARTLPAILSARGAY
jgi:exopolysaccharide biosynthesis polyprenyl glycosylphosphotransferase